MSSSRSLFFSAIILITGATYIFGFPVSAQAGEPDQELTGVVWMWAGSKYPNDTEAAPTDSSQYTLTLKEDGTVSVKADCNMAGGTWKEEGGRITITVTHSTRAMCPPDSLDSTYLKDLGRATIPFFRDGNLYFDLSYHSGTMKFAGP